MASPSQRVSLSLVEHELAEFILEVLQKMRERPDKMAQAANEHGATASQFVAVLLARYIVEKFEVRGH